MFRRRVHVGPSFQLNKLLSSSIRDPRVIARCPPLIRYRVPVIRGIVISVWPGSGLLRDIEHDCDGGCEDEAFKGGIFLGGLEMESVPETAESIRVLATVEPVEGSFGSGCEVTEMSSEPRVGRKGTC